MPLSLEIGYLRLESWCTCKPCDSPWVCSTVTRLSWSRVVWCDSKQIDLSFFILLYTRKLHTAYLYPWLPSMSSRPCLRDTSERPWRRYHHLTRMISTINTDLNSLSFTFFDIWMKTRTIQQFLILSFSPNFSFLVLSSSNAAYLPLIFEDVPISR